MNSKCSFLFVIFFLLNKIGTDELVEGRADVLDFRLQLLSFVFDPVGFDDALRYFFYLVERCGDCVPSLHWSRHFNTPSFFRVVMAVVKSFQVSLYKTK